MEVKGSWHCTQTLGIGLTRLSNTLPGDLTGNPSFGLGFCRQPPVASPHPSAASSQTFLLVHVRMYVSVCVQNVPSGGFLELFQIQSRQAQTEIGGD